MTADQDKCGLSSLLPMSCRTGAEEFARRLHSRLRTLGSQSGANGVDENSWLAAHENSVAVSQPRHSSSDSDLYFDFDLTDSPDSPEYDLEPTEFEKLINKDTLLPQHNSCRYENSNSLTYPLFDSLKSASSYDSDSSDGPFYDTENDFDPTSLASFIMNGLEKGKSRHGDSDQQEDLQDLSSKSEESNRTEDSYHTSELVTPVDSSSTLSDDLSTFSIQDEDSSPSEANYVSNMRIVPQETNSQQQVKLPETQPDDQTDEGCNETEAGSNNEENCCDRNGTEETYESAFTYQKDLTVECCPTTVREELEIVIDDARILERQAQRCLDEDDDDTGTNEVTPRVRRASSLKTGKTPPSTPATKKIVRFADAMGLDLEAVRMFMDEVPRVPTSAYNDLANADLNDTEESHDAPALQWVGPRLDKILMPLFQQPGSLPNFIDRVRDNCVCLENAIVEDQVSSAISGIVRVRNLDFHKSVHIRYSFDCWKSFVDVKATYLDNSCDGFSDRFKFLLYARLLSVGQRLELAVRFQCKGSQYWDNNNGANYCFQCLPSSTGPSYQPITRVPSIEDYPASFC